MPAPRICPDEWEPILHNEFLHRAPKYQHPDEVLVCQCRLPRPAALGRGSVAGAAGRGGRSRGTSGAFGGPGSQEVAGLGGQGRAHYGGKGSGSISKLGGVGNSSSGGSGGTGSGVKGNVEERSDHGAWSDHISHQQKQQQQQQQQQCDAVVVRRQWGCGDSCLNRMVAIECEPSSCPCGPFCSNQRFQRRTYVEMDVQFYGRKGYGLQLKQRVPSAGHFIIEYVGEVLNEAKFVERLKEYTARNQRHYYLMTLSGSEVIDACKKGNLSRFLNHSCNPNCRLEKWVVNGEVCIGVFSMRAINEVSSQSRIRSCTEWEKLSGRKYKDYACLIIANGDYMKVAKFCVLKSPTPADPRDVQTASGLSARRATRRRRQRRCSR